MKQYKIIFSCSVEEQAEHKLTAIDNAWEKFARANPFTYRNFDMTIEEIEVTE